VTPRVGAQHNTGGNEDDDNVHEDVHPGTISTRTPRTTTVSTLRGAISSTTPTTAVPAAEMDQIKKHRLSPGRPVLLLS
jgi:hypothetical protein